MKSSSKVKFVKEVAAGTEQLTARQPFRLRREHERRFVRLEISAPMSLEKIKDAMDGFTPQGDWHVIHGMVLNISAGGILAELDSAVNEGDVVSMHFTLQDVEGLENILGLVKRVDIEPDCSIAGIEFITRQHLTDHLTQGEMDLLGEDHCDFNERVHQILSRYITRESLAGEGR